MVKGTVLTGHLSQHLYHGLVIVSHSLYLGHTNPNTAQFPCQKRRIGVMDMTKYPFIPGRQELCFHFPFLYKN